MNHEEIRVTRVAGGQNSSAKWLTCDRVAAAVPSAAENRVPCGRLLAVLLTSSLSAGCTLLVDRPSTFSGAQRVAGITYEDGVNYLNSTYTKFHSHAKHLDKLDNGTKIGVATGVGAAGVSAVFRSGINVIVGFLSFGAANYSAHQLIDPKSVGDIFSAGISNLDCIDAAGSAAYQATAALRPTLPDFRKRLVDARDALQQDTVAAGANSKYAAEVGTADVTIASTNKVIAAVDRFYSGSNVGEAMVAAVNATISAVNQQLRDKSPNIDAIAQSGSIFSNFIGANAGLRSQAQSAVQNISKAIAQGAPIDASSDALQVRFAQHQQVLERILAIAPTMDASTLTSIASCRTQFAAEAPVTIQPSGTVTLSAGGAAVTLNVTGKAPVRVQWDGKSPSASDVPVSTNFSQVTFTATANAKADTYTFEIIDFAGKSSGEVQLTVTSDKQNSPAPQAQQKKAKPKPASNPAQPAAPAQPAPPAQPAGGPPTPPPNH